MGGKGSGNYPGNRTDNHRGGKTKKSAVSVAGTGAPELPDWLPAEAFPFWEDVVDKLQMGDTQVAYRQDSYAVAELASLLWRQSKLNAALEDDPTNDDLNRISLAVGRQARSLWEAFGMTPRSRQILVVPVEEQEEIDPLEQLRSR